MRGRVSVVLLGLAAGCADILGIDDGIPRTNDGGSDATVDAAIDAKVEVGPDTFSPLHCGSSVCDFGKGESCCWGQDGGFSCVASPGQCATGIDVPCDRSEQCAQDAGPAVCCATYAVGDSGAVATGVSCIGATKCNSGSSRFILCGDDSGVDCPADASCGLSSFSLPTFLICK